MKINIGLRMLNPSIHPSIHHTILPFIHPPPIHQSDIRPRGKNPSNYPSIILSIHPSYYPSIISNYPSIILSIITYSSIHHHLSIHIPRFTSLYNTSIHLPPPIP
jgi:hypothetical protein